VKKRVLLTCAHCALHLVFEGDTERQKLPYIEHDRDCVFNTRPLLRYTQQVEHTGVEVCDGEHLPRLTLWVDAAADYYRQRARR